MLYRFVSTVLRGAVWTPADIDWKAGGDPAGDKPHHDALEALHVRMCCALHPGKLFLFTVVAIAVGGVDYGIGSCSRS